MKCQLCFGYLAVLYVRIFVNRKDKYVKVCRCCQWKTKRRQYFESLERTT